MEDKAIAILKAKGYIISDYGILHDLYKRDEDSVIETSVISFTPWSDVRELAKSASEMRIGIRTRSEVGDFIMFFDPRQEQDCAAVFHYLINVFRKYVSSFVHP